MNADRHVMEFFPAPLTDAESQALMERIRSEFPTEGFGLYAVERLSDNELLGFVGLHRVTSSGELAGQIEIGWRLRSDMWGNGYAGDRDTPQKPPGPASRTPRNSASRNSSLSPTSETGVR